MSNQPKISELPVEDLWSRYNASKSLNDGVNQLKINETYVKSVKSMKGYEISIK